ncbi:MAB_1171c family putative transporter [Streptomyces sp. NPDC059443]|uniref:MAB_1171c family putative transporter n=1 Tax=unclassified Streptomyces TaxID=2593676 RepID=UPI0036CEFFBE
MNQLFELLSWACAIVSLAAFAYKLPKLRINAQSVTLFALCVYFLFNAVAYWVDLDMIRDQLVKAFNYPNITVIIVQASVVVLTAAQQVSIVSLTLPPERAKRAARRQVIGFGIALAILIALFAAIHPGKVSSAQETVYLNIADGNYALYMSYYLAICAIGRFQTVLFSFRYARTIRDFWLRLGMWCVAGGSALILVYCAVRYWQILALHTDFVGSAPWKFLFWLISDIGTLLQMLGWTVPSWGPKLGAVRPWITHYRAYRRLGPLWRAVARAAPEIPLEPARHRVLDWIPPRGLEYRLYRRVIEIRDGQLVLARMADPIAIHRMEQARKMEHEAVVEAALLKSALRGAAGRPVHDGLLPNRRTADISLPQEIRQLTRISQAFSSLGSRRVTGSRRYRRQRNVPS